MRTYVIIKYTGLALLLNSLFLFISFVISLWYNDSSKFALLYSSLIAFLLGVFPLIFVPPVQNISNREGILIVVSSWLITGIIGALPFYLYGGEFTFINAIFESVSGYSTTGASILTQVENLPKGILFWRSSTHWIGGIGIVLFILVIIPNIGQNSLVLFQSEMSKLAKESFQFRTKTAVKVLLWVYFGLTITETLLLILCGMDWFDAVTHSFATVATGGFSTKNQSIAYYNNIYIEIVIIIYMFLSGIHFAILFSTIAFRKTNIFRSEVVRYYFLMTLVSVILLTVNILSSFNINFFDSIRITAFQAVSIITTTGFATTDTTLWPFLSQVLLIFFSIHCACSGSTASGIKSDRFLILWKSLGRSIKKMHHPNAVIYIKLNNKIVSDEIIIQTLQFIILYIFILFVSTLLISITTEDIYTAFTGSVATLGNIGPGFGSVGSMSNYSGINDFSKVIYTINMLLGRLEIFVFLSFLNNK